MFAPNGFPDWCSLDDLDYDSAAFKDAVKQIQDELDLKEDGLCGINTVEAIAKEDYFRQKPSVPEGYGLLVIGARAILVCGRVRSFLDEPELATTSSWTRTRPCTQGIIHYDVTNSSDITHRVLKRRGSSIHFAVDHDATILQFHNPATRRGRHARGANTRSFGLDLNSPAKRKYEDLEPGQRPRRQVEDTVHGETQLFLDYWKVQIDALNAVLDVVTIQLKIPRQCPRDQNGQPIKACLREEPAFVGGKMYKLAHLYPGITGHYHHTPKGQRHTKIDPAPLDWDMVCPHEEP
jgi:hypothetical protein